MATPQPSSSTTTTTLACCQRCRLWFLIIFSYFILLLLFNCRVLQAVDVAFSSVSSDDEKDAPINNSSSSSSTTTPTGLFCPPCIIITPQAATTAAAPMDNNNATQDKTRNTIPFADMWSANPKKNISSGTSASGILSNNNKNQINLSNYTFDVSAGGGAPGSAASISGAYGVPSSSYTTILLRQPDAAVPMAAASPQYGNSASLPPAYVGRYQQLSSSPTLPFPVVAPLYYPPASQSPYNSAYTTQQQAPPAYIEIPPQAPIHLLTPLYYSMAPQSQYNTQQQQQQEAPAVQYTEIPPQVPHSPMVTSLYFPTAPHSQYNTQQQQEPPAMKYTEIPPQVPPPTPAVAPLYSYQPPLYSSPSSSSSSLLDGFDIDVAHKFSPLPQLSASSPYNSMQQVAPSPQTGYADATSPLFNSSTTSYYYANPSISLRSLPLSPPPPDTWSLLPPQQVAGASEATAGSPQYDMQQQALPKPIPNYLTSSLSSQQNAPPSPAYNVPSNYSLANDDAMSSSRYTLPVLTAAGVGGASGYGYYPSNFPQVSSIVSTAQYRSPPASSSSSSSSYYEIEPAPTVYAPPAPLSSFPATYTQPPPAASSVGSSSPPYDFDSAGGAGTASNYNPSSVVYIPSGALSFGYLQPTSSVASSYGYSAAASGNGNPSASSLYAAPSADYGYLQLPSPYPAAYSGSISYSPASSSTGVSSLYALPPANYGFMQPSSAYSGSNSYSPASSSSDGSPINAPPPSPQAMPRVNYYSLQSPPPARSSFYGLSNAASPAAASDSSALGLGWKPYYTELPAVTNSAAEGGSESDQFDMEDDGTISSKLARIRPPIRAKIPNKLSPTIENMRRQAQRARAQLLLSNSKASAAAPPAVGELRTVSIQQSPEVLAKQRALWDAFVRSLPVDSSLLNGQAPSSSLDNLFSILTTQANDGNTSTIVLKNNTFIFAPLRHNITTHIFHEAPLNPSPQRHVYYQAYYGAPLTDANDTGEEEASDLQGAVTTVRQQNISTTQLSPRSVFIPNFFALSGTGGLANSPVEEASITTTTVENPNFHANKKTNKQISAVIRTLQMPASNEEGDEDQQEDKNDDNDEAGEENEDSNNNNFLEDETVITEQQKILPSETVYSDLPANLSFASAATINKNHDGSIIGGVFHLE